ncbi:hypothetical protein HanLR1_Chr02g0046881 [Helianthus annuus]|nr:hypothetical protein HanLR1_Chr02g0046881 [Helianthus annuus]
MFSSVKPVVVIHLSEDLYTRSRMPLFRLLCPRFWYPLYTLSVTLRLIAGPITFLGRLLVLIIFLMAVILILIDPLDGFLMAEFLWIFLMRCLMKCLSVYWVDFVEVYLFQRVVVMGLAPIGCAPYYLWQYNSQNGECIKPINNVILEFNFVMRYTVE